MHLGACQSKIGLSYCFSWATNLADSFLRYMFSVSQRFFCTKLHHFLIGKSCICSRHQFEDMEMKEAQHLPWVKPVTSWSLGLISTTEFHSITSIRQFPTVLPSKFTSHFLSEESGCKTCNAEKIQSHESCSNKTSRRQLSLTCFETPFFSFRQKWGSIVRLFVSFRPFSWSVCM